MRQEKNVNSKSKYYRGYEEHIREHFPLYSVGLIELMTVSLARCRVARFVEGLDEDPIYNAELDKLSVMIHPLITAENKPFIEWLQKTFGDGAIGQGYDEAIMSYELNGKFKTKASADVKKEECIQRLNLNSAEESIKRKIYVGQTYQTKVPYGYIDEWYITIIDPLVVLDKIDSVSSVQWKWQSDNGLEYTNFESSLNGKLEAAFKRGEKIFDYPDNNWVFDFSEMTQLNKNTQSKRGIMRTDTSTPAAAASSTSAASASLNSSVS
jgi:hypothetical protein